MENLSLTSWTTVWATNAFQGKNNSSMRKCMYWRNTLKIVFLRSEIFKIVVLDALNSKDFIFTYDFLWVFYAIDPRAFIINSKILPTQSCIITKIHFFTLTMLNFMSYLLSFNNSSFKLVLLMSNKQPLKNKEKNQN